MSFESCAGVLDTVTPMKISACANLINAIVDPFLIFTMGMGVSGAALATVGAEVFSAFLFMYLMLKRKLIRWSKLLKLPSWTRLKPLIKGGAALQLRNVALNLTFLAVTRVTQTLDDTGVAAAAHAMALQTFQVGGIVLLALSVVAQTMIPNEMVEKTDPITGKKSGGILATKAVVNRLMSWGFLLGGILGALQIALLPILQKSSPLIEVREAALMPSILASVYQLINGLVFIGEGVMVGCGSFFQLSVSTMVATAGTIIALNTLPKKYGLTGVWMGFGVFNTLRLLGVWIHQKYGPLARRNLPSASS
jgi:MATE family multidrug resistance protein